MARSHRCRGALLPAIFLLAIHLSLAGGTPLPYGIEVAVEWGEPAGPESLRAALVAEIIDELRRAHCFETARAEREGSSGGTLLRLALTVDGYGEETEFDHGVAERGSGDPDIERLSISRIAADFDAAVRLVEEGTVVRERRFRHESSWRPLWREDPRQAAHHRLIEGVARRVRKFTCRGSPAKWASQIARARAAAAR